MDYNEIIKSGDFKKIEELFTENRVIDKDKQAKAIKQFNVKTHDIFNTNIRPDKEITKDVGEDTTSGTRKTMKSLSPVARVAMPYQKIIVNRRVGFMLSDPVYTEATFKTESDQEVALVELIERIQNDNKMDYTNKEIARRLMSEMEVAELWYFVENPMKIKPRFTLKVKILSPERGDSLYPLFDSTGDMIAFGRGYKIKDSGKEIEHFDVYTKEFEYKYININDQWTLDPEAKSYTVEGEEVVNPIPNPIGKIMVVYHSQPTPEWDEVETMIDRQETLVSNHADMNDYFGSPILKLIGEIQGFAGKGEQGKIIQLEKEADAGFLALNAPPESIKMEIDNLQKFIYSMSQTPDISFENMKSSIGNISGIALKLMFLDCHMAVKGKEEIFGMGLQRRLNLIKTCIGLVIDTTMKEASDVVQVKPVITPYLPLNVTEEVENLTVARNGGIISTQTAVEKNPLVNDSDMEMERISEDNNDELAGRK